MEIQERGLTFWARAVEVSLLGLEAFCIFFFRS